MNAAHTWMFPVKGTAGLANLGFVGKIHRGSATLKRVQFSRAAIDTPFDSLPTLKTAGVFAANGKLRTLSTGPVNLADTWSGYGPDAATPVNSSFYSTTFDGAPFDLFQGTSFEWAYLGGRTTEKRDEKKLLRFQINMQANENKHGRLVLQGYDAANRWYYPARFSATRWRFQLCAGLRCSLAQPVSAETDYNLDFLATSEGTALYIYPTASRPPAEPAHVFLAPLWSMTPYAMIYHGGIRIKKFEVLTGGELGAPSASLSEFADEPEKHPGMWITREIGGRYLSYQRVVPEEFGVFASGNHVYLIGTGENYETYSTGMRYARDTAKAASKFPGQTFSSKAALRI